MLKPSTASIRATSRQSSQSIPLTLLPVLIGCFHSITAATESSCVLKTDSQTGTLLSNKQYSFCRDGKSLAATLSTLLSVRKASL